MKRVLVTGAGGFLGHHVLKHLLVNTDWHLVALDSFKHRGKTDRICQVLAGHDDWRSRVDVVRHDLGAPVSVQMADKIGQIDYVLALASESHVDRSITDPVPFVENNVALALNTLEYCRQHKPAKIIWISTDEVYGPAAHGHDHVEWSPIIPSNPYSASKAAQEALCISYWRTYGLPIVLTNTMNLVGECQDVEKFVPLTISRVLAGESVPVHGRPGEIGSRYYLHARNHADAMVFLLNHLEPALFSDGNDRPARYHIVGDREVDNLEMAEMVADFAERPLRYELVDFHSARPGHDVRYGLDGSKIAALGWKAPVELAESLERTVRWTVNHPEWLK